MNLALFDLDNTLLPLDSDYEWGQFLCKIGAVDAQAHAARNAVFYAQYQNGTLDPIEYLEFAFGTLARFPRSQLDAWHAQFMHEVIQPAIQPAALALVNQHQEQGENYQVQMKGNQY
jgi:phosphoserine phosphatase